MKYKSVHCFCLKWTKQLSPNSFYYSFIRAECHKDSESNMVTVSSLASQLDKEIVVWCYHKELTPSCINNEKFLHAHRSCLFYPSVTLLRLCLLNQCCFFFLIAARVSTISLFHLIRCYLEIVTWENNVLFPQWLKLNRKFSP